jgi:hypothetical protein
MWRARFKFDGNLDKNTVTSQAVEPFRADHAGECSACRAPFMAGKLRLNNFAPQSLWRRQRAQAIVHRYADVARGMNLHFTRAGRWRVRDSAQGTSMSLFEGNYVDNVFKGPHYEVTHRATGAPAERGHHRAREQRPHNNYCLFQIPP